jgi:hypothetical protein
MGALADDLYSALAPFQAPEADNDYPLRVLCDALMAPLDTLYEAIGEDDDSAAWSKALDPENAPAWLLPWLAQWVGARLDAQDDEATQRDKIASPRSHMRGSVAELVAEVQAELTGAKTVYVDERYPSGTAADAWQLRVRTEASETPSEDRVLAAIARQKPIGIVLTYLAFTAGDWDDVAGDHTDWSDLAASMDDWDAVAATTP